MKPLTLKEISSNRVQAQVTDERLLNSLVDSTKSGRFFHKNDAETEVFFGVAVAVTAGLVLLAWLISLTGFWFIWFICAFLGAVPVFFTCALGLSLLIGFVSAYKEYRKELKEARRRGLIE